MYQSSLTSNELISEKAIDQTALIIDELAIIQINIFPSHVYTRENKNFSHHNEKFDIFFHISFFLVKDNIRRQALIMRERDYTASKYSLRKID